MAQEEEREEEEAGKVNRRGSHGIPESGRAWGWGSLGEPLGQKKLLVKQRSTHFFEKIFIVYDSLHISPCLRWYMIGWFLCPAFLFCSSTRSALYDNKLRTPTNTPSYRHA